MKRLLLLIALVASGISGKAQSIIPSLTASEFMAAVKSDPSAVVLDVRTSAEFSEGHIPGALLLDVMDKKEFREKVKSLDSEKTYYIYCRSGRRSMNAAAYMQTKGFRVRNLSDGILGWEKSGLTVVSQ